MRRFRAVIQDAGGGGAYLRVPFDVEKVFGRKRVKVKATFDGEPYRGSLVRMGEDCHMLPVLKEIRLKIGKSFGQAVSVTVQEDTEPRVVEVPPELARALALDKTAKGRFEAMSYTHRREHVHFIMEAKRDETRQRRVAKTVVELKKAHPLRG